MRSSTAARIKGLACFPQPTFLMMVRPITFFGCVLS
ncbi:hypothetical protein LINGRAHAP2_LOCUS8977 [Linum grandiflorum]